MSFSGGKDSTVLLHIARQLYPDIPAVFSNTGLEYPEIQRFVKTLDNVEIVVPKMRFDEVISTYGYPLISKEVSQRIFEARMYKNGNASRKRFAEKSDARKQYDLSKWIPLSQAPIKISHLCCKKMKKEPMRGKKAIVATMAEESRLRKSNWIRYGCNEFDSKDPKSQPMSFWTEQDTLTYIVKYGIHIASVYGDIVSVGTDGNNYPAVDVAGNVQRNLKCSGCQRTGCIFCAFGAHLEKGETRFQRLAKTHPRQYEYCIGGGEWIDNPFYDPAAPAWDGEWKNWNPKKIWSRNSKGLGLGKVFDICNEMYGKDFIKYD